jgi:hypothetical protein
MRRLPQAQRTIPVTTPAPVKGLNTVDPLAVMDPAYALVLQNWVCTPQGVSVRQGFRKWAINLPTSTTSLLQFNTRSGLGNKLFAVCGASIYDITSGGDMSGATPAVTGLNASNAYWQSVQQTFTTGSTNYLIAVNGANAPRIYDGTTWTTCTQVASPVNPGEFSLTASGGGSVSISSFVDVCLHNQRVWFVRSGSTIGYYLDIAQVGGTLYPFDFGPYFPRGGNLHKLATWTIDSGNGTQDYLVAISNKGDCVVYGGTNVASSSTWSKVGDYTLGSPVGRRCTTKLYGDLVVMTQDGLYPMSKYVQTSTLDRTAALTYNISPTISTLFETLADTPGFEATVYPSGDVMMLNVPQALQVNNYQFVFQTVQKAWSQFTGWPAQCYQVFNDALYFGGTDFVALAFIGYKDNADINGSNGSNLISTSLTAFNSFANEQLGPGITKHVKMVKPYIVTGQANPTIAIGVNTDFNLIPLTGSATVNPVTGAVWDSAYWDNPNATWAGTLTTVNQWSTPRCWPGTYAALALTVSAVAETYWVATNWLVAPSTSQFG